MATTLKGLTNPLPKFVHLVGVGRCLLHPIVFLDPGLGGDNALSLSMSFVESDKSIIDLISILLVSWSNLRRRISIDDKD